MGLARKVLDDPQGESWGLLRASARDAYGDAGAVTQAGYFLREALREAYTSVEVVAWFHLYRPVDFILSPRDYRAASAAFERDARKAKQ